MYIDRVQCIPIRAQHKKNEKLSDAKNESNTNRKKKSSLSDYFSSKTWQHVCVFWAHFWFKCEYSKEKWNRRIAYIKAIPANININVCTHISTHTLLYKVKKK